MPPRRLCSFDGCERMTNGQIGDSPLCFRHSQVNKRTIVDRSNVNRYEDTNGYILVRDFNGKFVSEHRVIMEKLIGRPLVKGESVHHKNGFRNDNREQNLELWIGPVRSGIRGYDLICPHCNHRYYPKELVTSG